MSRTVVRRAPGVICRAPVTGPYADSADLVGPAGSTDPADPGAPGAPGTLGTPRCHRHHPVPYSKETS